MKLPEVTWQTLDWTVLDRLRERFLAGRPSPTPYWTSLHDLANYDLTFGERIGWKWDAVLGELCARGWTPPAQEVLDWGCGSGVAGRRVVAWFGPERFQRLCVYDRSALAVEFACAKARAAFPGLKVEPAPELGESNPAGRPSRAPHGTLLVVSHVLSELTEAGGRALRRVIDQAAAVLWVEPGTFADSRALLAVREDLRREFLLIAPCTHQRACGLLAAGNERHWCHQFAPPPPAIMADADWVRFAQRAGIDLRSLPYSWLVLERRGLREPVPGLTPPGCSRVIGAPRLYKGFAKVFSCQAAGVFDVELPKRVAPTLFKQLSKGDGPRVCRWQLDGRRAWAPPEVLS
jgi:hypothetical protein